MRRLSIILLMLVLGRVDYALAGGGAATTAATTGAARVHLRDAMECAASAMGRYGQSVRRPEADREPPCGLRDAHRLWIFRESVCTENSGTHGSGLRQVVFPASSKHWPHYSRKRRRVPYWRYAKEHDGFLPLDNPTDPNREHFRPATFGSPRFL